MRNAPGASVQLGDARELLLPDDYVARACRGCRRAGSAGLAEWLDWAAAALAEMSRVTRSGGSVVLLAPELPQAGDPGRAPAPPPGAYPAARIGADDLGIPPGLSVVRQCACGRSRNTTAGRAD